VVLPLYNENPIFLEECLLSLVNQTYKDIEIIIIDDSDICHNQFSSVVNNLLKLDHRIVYIKNKKRLGLARSLNLGIESAKGRYIARIDSDDIANIDRLKKQFIFLEKNLDIQVLGSNIRIFNKDSRFIYEINYPEKHKEIIKRFNYIVPLAHPSLMVRKDTYFKYGFYNVDYKYCEDLDLWLRWINAGVKFHNLQEQLIDYRFDDSVYRSYKHWYFNILARVSNFNLKNLHLKLFGLFGLFIFVLLPNKIKLKIFSLIK
jgi:glycosyltransferase involved in cell wall biosynthesis